MATVQPIGAMPRTWFSRSTVVVLGNSGSLLETPRQDSWALRFEKTLVIGVNRQLRAGRDGRRYTPDWLVVSDIRAMETEWLEIESGRSPGMALLVPPWVSMAYTDAQWEKLTAKGRLSGVYEFPAHNDGHTMAGMKQRAAYVAAQSLPMRWGDPLVSTANVGFHALQLALLTVPGRVLILGMEGRWPKHYRRQRYDHFYPVRPIPERQRPFPLSNVYNDQWARLKEWAEVYFGGTAIYDLSPWEDESVLPFDRGRLDMLLTD